LRGSFFPSGLWSFNQKRLHGSKSEPSLLSNQFKPSFGLSGTVLLSVLAAFGLAEVRTPPQRLPGSPGTMQNTTDSVGGLVVMPAIHYLLVLVMVKGHRKAQPLWLVLGETTICSSRKISSRSGLSLTGKESAAAHGVNCSVSGRSQAKNVAISLQCTEELPTQTNKV
ncbi:MAG: hypothetical protein L0Z53_12680, partial [Acidobacteriales bacterium]|nr:hypothetical protein [Terriglobales bacterium]